MTPLEIAVIVVGLSIGLLNWIGSLIYGGNIPVLSQLVTIILLGCCIFVTVAIIQKVQAIVAEVQTRLASSEGFPKSSKTPENSSGATSGVDIEALALAMQDSEGLEIKNRRHRLNVYSNCFVGSEAVDWLVQQQKCTREEAVVLGQAMVDQGIIRHVSEAHPFQDDSLFYRFYWNNRSKLSAATALSDEKLAAVDIEALVKAMREPGGVEIKSRRHRLNVYPACFVGLEAVDWLVEKRNYTREEAVGLGQILIEREIIHHVTDEHPFRDDFLFYRFYADEQ